MACTHYKRTFNAHEITVAALYRLFVREFFKENPEIEEQFLKIIATVEFIKEGHRSQLLFVNDIPDKLHFFRNKLLRRNLCKFIFNYIEMYERSQEFVFASRTQNWKLHLESCPKLAVDFHAIDRIKYMRMFPYYIKTQLALEERDTATWKWLNEGQFSVVKSRLPFVGIGVDHAGE